MDLLHSMLGEIRDPWYSELRSILVSPESSGMAVGDLVMMYGTSTLITDNVLFGHKVDFKPFHGLVPTNINLVIEIDGGSFPSIPCGTNFGVSNARVISLEPLTIRLLRESQFWTVSDFEKSWQPSFCHLFAGAFEGWSRAIEWVHHFFGYGYFQSMAIDHDEDVMRVWSVRNNFPFQRPPFQIGNGTQEKIVGILANVREHTWVNKCLALSNFWITLSPPCISWSLGGRAAGLEHDAGIAFAFAIEKIQLIRPVGVVGECADATPKHPHCKILKALLSFAGYRLIWDSVQTLHHVSPMMRNRWLFVWIRNDISFDSVPRTVPLKERVPIAWNDEMYSFFIPDQISHQLKLSKRLLDIYGDSSLLPKVKRANLPPCPKPDDVLRARCPDSKSPLPTLCASYTTQHMLSESHIRAKGIFAFLMHSCGEFHFLDPFRFCAYLGLPQSQVAVIPSKISIAFKQIGNAIAVHHALISLAVAMNAVGCWKIPIQDMISSLCNQRICASQSIVVKLDDFYVVLPVPVVLVCFSKFVGTSFPIQNRISDETRIIVVFAQDEWKWEVMPTTTIESFFRGIGIERPSCQFLKCIIDFTEVSWNLMLSKCVGKYIQIQINSEAALSFRIDAVVQPTQEWTPDDQTILAAAIEAEKCAICPTEDVIVFCIADDNPIRVCLDRDADDCTVSAQLDAICNPQSTFKEPCWVECLSHPFRPEIKRCFVVDRHEKHDREIKYFLLIDHVGCARAAFIHELQPFCVFLDNLGLPAVEIKRNDIPVDSHRDIHIEDGDIIILHPSEACDRSIVEAKLARRFEAFNENCEKAAIDEFTFALDFIREKAENTFVNPVVDLTVISDAADVITHLHWALDCIDLNLVMKCKCFFPFLLGNHWCAIETSYDGHLNIRCVGVPSHLLSEFFDTFVRKVNIEPSFVIRMFLPLIGIDGLCGWTILKRWFQKSGVPHPIVKAKLCDRLFKAHFSDFLRRNETDPGYLTFREICKFAICIRAFFICHLRISPKVVINLEDNPRVGPGTDDVKMDQPNNPQSSDPWLRHDPWSTKDKPKQCKWEDLQLPPTHPFVTKDNKPVTQVHRQRLTPHAGGIAFATKSQVPMLLQLHPSEPAAILIPAIDQGFFDSLQMKPTFSGPHEVIVVDSSKFG